MKPDPKKYAGVYVLIDELKSNQVQSKFYDAKTLFSLTHIKIMHSKPVKDRPKGSMFPYWCRCYVEVDKLLPLQGWLSLNGIRWALM